MSNIRVFFLGSLAKPVSLLGTFIIARDFIMVNNTGIGGVLIICLPGGNCQTAFICFARAVKCFSNMFNSVLVTL